MIIDKVSLKKAQIDGKKEPYVAYQVGEYYYTENEYEKAVEWYKIATNGEQKEPLALFALGYAYQFGQGVPVDLIQALHYYEEAANEDVPQACYNLAFFYQNGLGVKKDQQKADYYVLRATECLKRLTEEINELRSIQKHIQDRYEEALQSIIDKSNDWKQLSQECIDQKEQQVKLQAQIEKLTEQLTESKLTIKRYQKDLSKKEKSYEQLAQTHSQVLDFIDEQNEKISQLTTEKESAWTERDQKNTQCSVLEERINQQEREIEDLCQLQNENQSQQLGLQKTIDELQYQIAESEKELENSQFLYKQTQDELEKEKKKKWLSFFLGIALAGGIAAVTFFL